MEYILEFEKPILDLENRIKELKNIANGPNIDLAPEIKALQDKVEHLLSEIYANLNSWDRVQISRHPLRPHFIDYLNNLFTDFHELSGDRNFSNDSSIICGAALFNNFPVMIIGIEKGRKTKEKVLRNFGMPKPEGYRKALRIMKLASQFNIPLITFIDTPGAYPGIDAEERGQSQAIGDNISEMFDLKCPIISIIIGEGGSGGALGLGIADSVVMMEYSIYSVISPESCASILWSDPKLAEKASFALKLDAEQALKHKVIDQIIPEPIGGAHRRPQEAIKKVQEHIKVELENYARFDVEERLNLRFEKFRKMGNQTLVKGQVI
jgi:acetyl-CoA carboxylase carboxyl transferase subunit alpha